MKLTYIAVEGTPDELQQLEQWPAIARQLSAAAEPAADADPAVHNPAADVPVRLPGELDAFISTRAGNNPAQHLLRRYAAEAIAAGVAEWHIGQSSKEPDGRSKYFSLYAPGPRRVGAASYVHPVNGRTTFRLSWDDPAIQDVKKSAFKASDDPTATYAVGIMITSEAALEEAQALLAAAVEKASA